MLKSLRSFFRGADPEIDAPEETNPSFITNPKTILKLLEQIITAPPLSTVKLPNSEQVFYTSVLDVQPENQRLLFDKLNPPSGNTLLSECSVLKLSTAMNGMSLTFSLKDIVPSGAGSRLVYQAALPESIYCPQRRSSPRIRLDSTRLEIQGVSEATGLRVGGYAVDISRSGACITFSRQGAPVNPGDKLKNCQLKLPNDNVLVFDFSARSVRKTTNLSMRREIGGFFSGLSAQGQNRLDRYLCALERQQIRKQKNGTPVMIKSTAI